ncbi:MAG: hypothetical protein CME63_04545 [Halobacteriovoraceae bacterium]|nr:hypothetical protein [Halobacteriovoraceae bacterium]|tara:strand:- start:61517 stop:61936 length:420 start_codon:yes stop_codon:yes gene_type:complete
MENKLLDQINADIKEAMKAKEKERLQALRYLKSMLMENSTSQKPVPEMDVVIKHDKKLKDSLHNFPEEHPMHQQTLLEIKVMEKFLPQPLSEAEVQNIINDIKSKLDSPNMGAIMKELQPQIKGRFDGKKASQMVKDSL